MTRRQNIARRGSFAVIDGITVGERHRGVHRAERQCAAAASQVGLKIAGSWDAGAGLSIFEGPLLLGAVDHTEVIDTVLGLRD